MITSTHARFLAQAVAGILGTPHPGAVAFLRCLSSKQVDQLIELPEFQVPGFKALAVVDQTGNRRIRADEAVALREDKEDPVLLLVDPLRAGAGMDGIYSASREITEAELFNRATDLARAQWRSGTKGTSNDAIRKSRRLGRGKPPTPWQIFDFHVAGMDGATGAALSRLGLWPIDGNLPPDSSALEKSLEMANRLLVSRGDNRTVTERIAGLMLDDADGSQTRALESFLRDVDGKSSLDAVRLLEDRHALGLGQVEPRYSSTEITGLELHNWRKPNGGLYSWTGLADEDDRPVLVLDRQAPHGKKGSRLEVRWKPRPDGLAKGSVDYHVRIVAGQDEELAVRHVSHVSKKTHQSVVFDLDDFADLSEDDQFEAAVELFVEGLDHIETQRSEEFLIRFGQVPEQVSQGSGRIVRALIEGAVHAPDEDTFAQLLASLPTAASLDKQGNVCWRPGNGIRAVKVFRPHLLALAEAEWASKTSIGRWQVRVRDDGLPHEDLEWIPIDSRICPPEQWARLEKATRTLIADLPKTGGILARTMANEKVGSSPVHEYLLAWEKALEDADPALALAGTIEVRSLSDRRLGMIVLPWHPVRLAWMLGYDALAYQARFDETGQASGSRVEKMLATLDSGHFPAFLPGLEPGQGFVFGDMLGFHLAAMVPHDESEPRAVIALMAKCVTNGHSDLARSKSEQASGLLAREIAHYLAAHEQRGQNGTKHMEMLRIQALGAGDGATVVRALGETLAEAGALKPQEDEWDASADLCFHLDFQKNPNAHAPPGRFLSEISQRRRAGAGAIGEEDRWIADSVTRPGNIAMPRLQWARREPGRERDYPAHLAFAFDIFESRIEADETTSDSPAPLHTYGLSVHYAREVTLGEAQLWRRRLPRHQDGISHPANKLLTQRLLTLQSGVAKATARKIGGIRNSWPVMTTRLTPENRDKIDRLHESNDWVVTVDRNACIEYFDSPQAIPRVYDQYVIDCTPERSDLGSLQLVTSTSNLGEVRSLTDSVLGEMGLSSSERNCRFLVDRLKSISGRFAIRLSGSVTRASELIGLALLQAHCIRADGEEEWLPLQEGFFIPIDEIDGFIPIPKAEADGRTALIFVRALPKGPLEFHFIGIKYRRHLRSARVPETLEALVSQTARVRQHWYEWFFSEKLSRSERIVRRSALARMLEFYACKAERHSLHAESFKFFAREIDKILKDEDWSPAEPQLPDRGYIYCPEVRGGTATLAHPYGEDVRLFLFGPQLLPDGGEGIPEQNSARQEASHVANIPDSPNVPIETFDTASEARTPLNSPPVAPAEMNEKHPDDASEAGVAGRMDILNVSLGTNLRTDEKVSWALSIRANPHLMVVGQPGMGKTTCLINVCKQLNQSGITPIVFSFHDDIDERLAVQTGEIEWVDFNGLGFNPLRTDNRGKFGHIDVAGELRDIFSSIFPDLGDLQLEEIRKAILDSYTAMGWSADAVDQQVDLPAFGDFYDILQRKKQTASMAGVQARLRELADYGFFTTQESGASLLDRKRLTVVRIHKTSNDALQRAFASFVLYNIYKEMFRRGVQPGLTHAIIFDEAHRASRLKLIPTMAKECRKYGLSLILASQEARDFQDSVFAAIANHLVLRVTEADARKIARMLVPSDQDKRTADRLKSLDKYKALFMAEGQRTPLHIALFG